MQLQQARRIDKDKLHKIVGASKAVLRFCNELIGIETIIIRPNIGEKRIKKRMLVCNLKLLKINIFTRILGREITSIVDIQINIKINRPIT